MIFRLALFAIFAMASVNAHAQCDHRIDYNAGIYAQHPNLDGVGIGSTPAERNAAAFTAVSTYRLSRPQPNRLPNNSRLCVEYDDDSTEQFAIACQSGSACIQPIENTFTAPPTWGGGGAPGFYFWGGGGWRYNGPVGCVNCIQYYGTVGPVIPIPRDET